MKTLTFLLMIITTINLFAQHKVNGYVRDAESGETLIGATVIDKSLKYGATTNNYGYFSLQIPDTIQKLEVSFVGYDSQIINVSTEKIINIKLLQKSDELTEVEVVRSAPTRLSMNRLSARTISRLPVVLGESDITRTLQMLPGVTAGTEATSGYFVRGGDADQNLLLIDGTPIYNAYHLFGLFSVFNSDAINDARFYKGSIPVEYGNCLSSVMDISLREGNMNKYSGEVSLGTFASKFLLEGPIIKDRTSFLVTGRRSMLDIMPEFWSDFVSDISGIKDAHEASAETRSLDISDYYFGDINAKLNHCFSERSRLFASFYYGKDENPMKDVAMNMDFASDFKESFDFSNRTMSLRYNQVISDNLYSNLTVYNSRYKYNKNRQSIERRTNDEKNTESTFSSLESTSQIDDYSIKIDFSQNAERQVLNFGAQYNFYAIDPSVEAVTQKTKNDDKTIDINNDLNFSYEIQNIGVFASNKLQVTDNFEATLGFRADVLLTDGKTYFSPQPRVLLNYRLPMNITAKASYARTAQSLHKLSLTSNGSPSDMWVSATQNYAPSTADEAVLGLGVPFFRNIFLLTIEGYYKQMHKLLGYSEGASYNSGDIDWQYMVEVGRGKSYGLELCLKKEVGKTSGWISYTLSKTNRQFDNINNGCEYPFTFDRTHNVAIALMQQLGKHFDFGANWIYMTGNAFSMPTSSYFYGDLYTSKNAARLPDAHRLDVCLNYKTSCKLFDFKLSVGAYNAYAHKNPYYVTKKWDSEYYWEVVNLFSTIPYLTLDFKF